jgi:hypothetical protein
MSFDNACADVVISNIVHHPDRDGAQFESMLLGLWRVLELDRLFVRRLDSEISRFDL